MAEVHFMLVYVHVSVLGVTSAAVQVSWTHDVHSWLIAVAPVYSHL